MYIQHAFVSSINEGAQYATRKHDYTGTDIQTWETG